MFTRVLFPTDFSRHAERVAGCLNDLRALGTEEIVLINVVEPGVPTSLATDYVERVFEWKRDSEQRMQELARRVEGFGMRVLPRVEIGEPYAEIPRVAAEEGVSLIAMGSHGHGFIRGVVLGSVTHEVVRHSPVPVLVMKLKLIENLGAAECEFVCEHMFQRILLPTDFSACALEALGLVKGLRAAGAQEAIVLHVQDSRTLTPHHEHPQGDDQADMERMEGIRQQLEFWGFRTKGLLRTGVPSEEIDRVAREEDVSLIVMGSKGRSALADALLGSVSDAIVCRHVRPVLVVRAEEMSAAAR